jgi:hypothetical protein
MNSLTEAYNAVIAARTNLHKVDLNERDWEDACNEWNAANMAFDVLLATATEAEHDAYVSSYRSTATLPKVTVHAKEGAALIRKTLKKAFPGTKFSVCMSPGGAIRVSYTNGPRLEDVKMVALQFGSEQFDGRDDSPRQEYRDFMIDGSPVLHSIYAMIFVDRDYCDGARAAAKAAAERCSELFWKPQVWIMEKYGCRYYSDDMYDPRNLAETYMRAMDYITGRHD